MALRRCHRSFSTTDTGKGTDWDERWSEPADRLTGAPTRQMDELSLNELVNLGEVSRDCGERVLVGLVFKDDVALEIGVLENPDQAGEIALGTTLLAARLDFDFELDVDGVRGAALDVAVGIVGMEVPGIQIDADPGIGNRFDDLDQRIRFGDDAAVVFDAEKHATIGGVFTAFFQTGDAVLDRLFLIQFAAAPRKDPNMRGAHHLGVIDPAFDIVELFRSFGSGGMGEGIADGRATDRHAAEEGMTFDSAEELAVDIGGKIIPCQLGARATVIRAEIDEIEETDLFIRRNVLASLVRSIAEILTEGIGGHAGEEAWFPGTMEGFDSESTFRRQSCQGSEATGLTDELTTIQMVFHWIAISRRR